MREDSSNVPPSEGGTIVPSVGGEDPGRTWTMSPSSRWSLGIFSIRAVEDGFSSLSLAEGVEDT